MTSFSRFGMPISLHGPPLAASQPAKSTFSWVKNSSMLCRSEPRSDERCELVRPTPTTVRPRPSVCPRSAKIGPADVRRSHRNAGLEAEGLAAARRADRRVGDAGADRRRQE